MELSRIVLGDDEKELSRIVPGDELSRIVPGDDEKELSRIVPGDDEKKHIGFRDKV